MSGLRALAADVDSKEVSVTGRRKPPAAGKGRPKGAVNKTTKAVKEALSIAFDELGGVDALKTWAQANQTQFYQLWGKMLPLQVAGDEENPLVHKISYEIIDASDSGPEKA